MHAYRFYTGFSAQREWSHVSHLHHSLQLMAPHQVGALEVEMVEMVTLEGLVGGKE